MTSLQKLQEALESRRDVAKVKYERPSNTVHEDEHWGAYVEAMEDALILVQMAMDSQ